MSKIKRTRELSKLALAPEEQVIVALDVHKRSYHVAVWSLERGLLTQWVQPAVNQVVLDRIKPITAHIKQVVYESGPTGFALAHAVRAAGLTVLVAAASKVPSEPGRQPKTDRLDCIRLAQLAAWGLLKAVCIPNEQEQADRQIGRLREQVARKLRRCKQQIKSFLLFYSLPEPAGLKDWTKAAVEELGRVELNAELRFCLDELLEELDELTKRQRRITARLRELARTERHREAVGRLRRHPGVGLITAMTYRLELIQPGRFDHAGQVARATGLAPGVRRSGQTHHGGPILKSGNPRIRSVLVEAAWRAIRLDPVLRHRWQHLAQQTASGKKAIVAIARLMAERLWRCLIEPPHEPAQAA